MRNIRIVAIQTNQADNSLAVASHVKIRLGQAEGTRRIVEYVARPTICSLNRIAGIIIAHRDKIGSIQGEVGRMAACVTSSCRSFVKTSPDLGSSVERVTGFKGYNWRSVGMGALPGSVTCRRTKRIVALICTVGV